MCTDVLPVHVCLPCVLLVSGGQKTMSDPLEPQLLMVVTATWMQRTDPGGSSEREPSDLDVWASSAAQSELFSRCFQGFLPMIWDTHELVHSSPLIHYRLTDCSSVSKGLTTPPSFPVLKKLLQDRSRNNCPHVYVSILHFHSRDRSDSCSTVWTLHTSPEPGW